MTTVGFHPPPGTSLACIVCDVNANALFDAIENFRRTFPSSPSSIKRSLMTRRFEPSGGTGCMLIVVEAPSRQHMAFRLSSPFHSIA